jgi:ABC-2 type transport system permease protein
VRALANIFWLGTKELRSFGHDIVLLCFVIYSFSLMIISQAQSTALELHNAAVGVADEDRSELSLRIVSALLPPNFKPPQAIAESDIDRSMDAARYTFVIDVPPNFERDVSAGRQPALQLDVDATAMMQAGIGAGYIEEIANAEIARYVSGSDDPAATPVDLAVRVAFNPNVYTSWFNSVMGIINNITMISILLAGAALIREREHGTMDHLLVMPLSPFEIAMAKVWANGLVITLAAGLSLEIVVRGVLQVPVTGSVPLFMAGVVIYLFFSTAVGIFLGTVARSMPQLGLLSMLVMMPMNLLSGASTPLESMPAFLQAVMELSPSTHFVSFAQAILYRGAGLDVVWREFAAVAAIGGVFFGLALFRFRRVAAAAVT